MYTRSTSRHDPSYCFPVQRYYSSRTTKSHSNLTGIEVRLVGCTTLYQMRYLAGEVRVKRPKGPVYRDALGGSSHGANFTSGEPWAYLQALLAAVNVRFGMAAIHTSAYGRMDFHFLAVDDNGTGRSLAGSGQSFARRLRLASIELVTQLNLQRLREGRFVIANLTPKGRVYWMRERERLVKEMELNGIVPNWESSNERPCLFPWEEGRLELDESKSDCRQKAEPKAPKKSGTGPCLKPVTEVLAKPLEKCSEKPVPDPGEMPAEEKLAVLGKLDPPATLPGAPALVEASSEVSEARAVIKDAQQLKAIMTTVNGVLVGSDRLLQPLGDAWWTASVQVQFPERPTVKRYLEDCVARLRGVLDAKPLSWELQRRSLTETLARIEARVKTETLDVGAATVVVVTHPPAGPVAVKGAEDAAPKSPGLTTKVPEGAGEPSTLLPVVAVDKGSATNLAAMPVQPEAVDQTPKGDERFTGEKQLGQAGVEREPAEDLIRQSVANSDGLTRADIPPGPAAILAKAAEPLNPPNPESVEGAALAELERLVGEISAARRQLLLLAAAARNGNRIERSAVLADGSMRLDTYLQTQLQRIDELLKQCPNLGDNEAKVVAWARTFLEPEQTLGVGGMLTLGEPAIKLTVAEVPPALEGGAAATPLVAGVGAVAATLATHSRESGGSDQGTEPAGLEPAELPPDEVAKPGLAEKGTDGTAPVAAADLAKAVESLNLPSSESVEGAALAELGRLVGEITEARRPLFLLAAAVGHGNRIERSAVLADGSRRLDSFLQTQLERIDDLLKRRPNLGDKEAAVVAWARKFLESEQEGKVEGVAVTADAVAQTPVVNPIKSPVFPLETLDAREASTPPPAEDGSVATISNVPPPSGQPLTPPSPEAVPAPVEPTSDRSTPPEQTVVPSATVADVVDGPPLALVPVAPTAEKIDRTTAKSDISTWRKDHPFFKLSDASCAKKRADLASAIGKLERGEALSMAEKFAHDCMKGDLGRRERSIHLFGYKPSSEIIQEVEALYARFDPRLEQPRTLRESAEVREDMDSSKLPENVPLSLEAQQLPPLVITQPEATRSAPAAIDVGGALPLPVVPVVPRAENIGPTTTRSDFSVWRKQDTFFRFSDARCAKKRADLASAIGKMERGEGLSNEDSNAQVLMLGDLQRNERTILFLGYEPSPEVIAEVESLYARFEKYRAMMVARHGSWEPHGSEPTSAAALGAEAQKSTPLVAPQPEPTVNSPKLITDAVETVLPVIVPKLEDIYPTVDDWENLYRWIRAVANWSVDEREDTVKVAQDALGQLKQSCVRAPRQSLTVAPDPALIGSTTFHDLVARDLLPRAGEAAKRGVDAAEGFRDVVGAIKEILSRLSAESPDLREIASKRKRGPEI